MNAKIKIIVTVFIFQLMILNLNSSDYENMIPDYSPFEIKGGYTKVEVFSIKYQNGKFEDSTKFKHSTSLYDSLGDKIIFIPYNNGKITYPTRKFNYDSTNKIYETLYLDSNSKIFVKIVSKFDSMDNQIEYQQSMRDSVIYHTFYKYNQIGKKIEEIGYNYEDTSFNYKCINKYDKYGNMTDEYTYSFGDSIHNNWFIEYDSINNTEKHYEHLEDTLILDEFRKFDANRNLIEKINYDDGGDISSTHLYEYDGNNKTIKRTHLNYAGKLEEQVMYKYNDNGALIEKITKGRYQEYSRFTYNKDGKSVERGFYDKNSNIKRLDAYRYDEFGNITEIIYSFCQSEPNYKREFVYTK